MESARIFRGWQGAAARHSGDYGEEPQRGQPRKRPPTSHANFRDTTLAAATATAQQDVPQRRTDAITAIRLDEMMLHVMALQPDKPRSEERRGGKGVCITGNYRWCPYH